MAREGKKRGPKPYAKQEDVEQVWKQMKKMNKTLRALAAFILPPAEAAAAETPDPEPTEATSEVAVTEDQPAEPTSELASNGAAQAEV